MHSFFQGAVIGVSIAAPVGPIGLLCIRRSLNEGRLAGFVSGLGAASADALYGVVAVTGLSAVTAGLLQYQFAIQLCGAAFLMFLGVSIIRTPALAPSASPASGANLLNAYASTFLLTLGNPATILSFIGIFAGLGIGSARDSSTTTAAALTVTGVFIGSACWWLILSAAASWLGPRVSRSGLRFINVIAGSVLIGFAVWQLITVSMR